MRKKTQAFWFTTSACCRADGYASPAAGRDMRAWWTQTPAPCAGHSDSDGGCTPSCDPATRPGNCHSGCDALRSSCADGPHRQPWACTAAVHAQPHLAGRMWSTSNTRVSPSGRLTRLGMYPPAPLFGSKKRRSGWTLYATSVIVANIATIWCSVCAVVTRCGMLERGTHTREAPDTEFRALA